MLLLKRCMVILMDVFSSYAEQVWGKTPWEAWDKLEVWKAHLSHHWEILAQGRSRKVWGRWRSGPSTPPLLDCRQKRFPTTWYAVFTMCTSYSNFIFPPPAKSSSPSFFGMIMCHIFSSYTQLNSYLIYRSDVKLEKKKSSIELLLLEMETWRVAVALVD